MARIKSRNRAEEKDVTLQSLHNIHNKYEAWIADGASGYPVVIIDADQDPAVVQKSIETHLKHRQILR